MGKGGTGSRSGGVSFVAAVRSGESEARARAVIESLRTFGGPLRDCPVWVFVTDTDRMTEILPGLEGVRRLSLFLGGDQPSYPFAEKVYACARAEELAGPEVCSIVWLSLDCLIVNPPLLLDLGASPDAAEADAAFLPVHHQNVGSLASAPLDDFWRDIYQALEVDEMPHTVESFVGRRTLRPYFNTHCFSFSPALNLGRAWRDRFTALVADEAFQSGPCSDVLHRIFLHQAVLSTLVAQQLDWSRLRVLPAEYNFPLNLLEQMKPALRPASLSNLVSIVCEGVSSFSKIEAHEPLRSWLQERQPVLSGER